VSGLVERAASVFVAAEPDPLRRRSVSGIIERAASVFVAAPEPVAAPARFASRALVLGSAHDAIPVAAALAGGLRERERAAGALLIAWPGVEPPRASLATPAASRLVAGLQARGLDAVARGRLAWLSLTDLALARRALAAVDVPAVVAITGPRSARSDELLADQDQLVLVVPADEDPRLTGLVRHGVAECGVPLVVRSPLSAPGARTTALAGWGRLRVVA
jgi:hypothetical protein